MQRVAHGKVDASPATVNAVLEVMGKGYEKGFPPLDWNFVEKLSCDPALTVNLLAQQVEISR